MPPRSETNWFLIAWVAAAVVYDIYALWRWGVTGTISYAAAHWCGEYPIIAIAVGAVLGHCLWKLPPG